ncbi:MAG: RIO kinase 1 [Cellvibrionaceae bacterium]|jgi:RIO kinase 1
MSQANQLNSDSNQDIDYSDKYDELAEATLRHNHARLTHKANRIRIKGSGKTQPTRREVLKSLADESDFVEDFIPTYAAGLDPKHFERRWVIESLSSFYRDKLISDVLSQVKVGKEANVYVCAGPKPESAEGESNDEPNHANLIAAKLYRPRMFRHLRNDAAYKIGRLTHNREGKKVRRNSGIERAAKKKSNFGQDLEFSNWIGHEYRMQTKLYAAGADVPKPIAHAGNVILMAFCGDQHMPASTLNDVHLDPAEAQPLFDQVLENIELMLGLNLVHGDLSSYNILYWAGEITIIDFPQMVDATVNPNAEKFLQRDVQRIVDYFTPYGVTADSLDLSLNLWQRFMDGELTILD